MGNRVGLVIVGVAFAASGLLWAAEVPLAVSPGSADGVAQVELRCPTFSWGSVPGAKSFELVVYRLGEEGEEAQPVLRETFAGPVSGWTPSLDRCLERGGRYAWSVRAVGRKEASGWSAPNLFQVSSGPSEAEFEEALRVVRQYLSEETTGSVEGSAGAVQFRSLRQSRTESRARAERIQARTSRIENGPGKEPSMNTQQARALRSACSFLRRLEPP